MSPAHDAYVFLSNRFTVKYEQHASLEGSELKLVKQPGDLIGFDVVRDFGRDFGGLCEGMVTEYDNKTNRYACNTENDVVVVVSSARCADVTLPDRFIVEYEQHASLKGSELKLIKRPKLSKVVIPRVVLPHDEARLPIICVQHCGKLVFVSMIKLVWQAHQSPIWKSTYDPLEGVNIIKHRTPVYIKDLVPLLNPNTNRGYKQPAKCLVCGRHFCRCRRLELETVASS